MLNKLKIRKNLYNVRIVNGDSKIETVALEDTGNSLREPYKGRPVSVLQYNVIKQILTGNEKCFLIPFKSVGSQNGILTGITVDYMEIKNRDINLKISNPVLGIYKGMFNNDKKYQMLLNSEFILHNSETNQKQIGDCENCNMHSQFWNKVNRWLRNCNACPQLKIKERREKLLKNLNVIPVLTRWILSDESNEVHYIGGPDVLPAPLEGEEEAKQLEKLINENDESARRMLIEHNLRLVVYIAKKFDNTGVGVEDLISIGTIGLIKGINTFKTDKNIKLATYASRCIENEILMYLRRNNKTKLEVSIDEPLNVDWDGNELLLSDILGTDEDVISRGLENEVEKSLLKKAIEKLNKREKSIVEMRFGLNNKDGEEMTQKEVADFLGISQSYISRLEKKIMNRLKKEIVKYE